MKKIILFASLYLLLFFEYALAQKENNVWAFSKNIGLDFNSGSPVIIPTKIDAFEGCTSVCDASGALLFYSNGLEVFDSTHNVMPNSRWLKGGEYRTTTQGVVISPIIGEPGMFFVFTLDAATSKGELHYSLIDMKLNAGKGDIVPGFKNILLGEDMSEKMVLASSCSKVWLITHDRKSPIFYVWSISSSSRIPIALPSSTLGKSGMQYIYGEMKMSTDFRSIYMVNYGGNIERFSFDLGTGHVGDYLNIDSVKDAYSIEVSSNNEMLYMTERLLEGDSIFQYDLSLLPDIAAVRASKNRITTGVCIRRGPDNKIYVNDHGNPGKISRINNPERYGAACNLEINVPELSHKNLSGYFQFGNNTVPAKGVPDETIFSRMDTILCSGTVAIFSMDESYGTVTWNDGSSTSKKEIRNAGIYWRSYRKECIGYSDTIVVKGFHKPDTISRKLLDTIVCFLPSLEVKTDVSSDQYNWSDGGNDKVSIFRNTDTRWVSALNNDKYCVYTIDTFSVSFTNFNIPLRDTFICLGESISLDAGTKDATAYRWSNGSDQSKIQANKENKYWVSVRVGSCSKTDTVTVYSRAFNLDLGLEENVCKGSRVLIDPKISEASYVWQDGSKSSTYYATDSGLYSVTITKNGCTEKAELTVRYLNCVACIGIPNAFSPNNDGANDFFRVISRCPALKYEMLIVDRYGTVVFSTKEITQGWDGRFNGRELELGVYYYLVRATFDRGSDIKEELFKGDVSLLR